MSETTVVGSSKPPEAEPPRLGFRLLLGDGLFYGLGPMVARLLGFITLPFVAQALGPEGFGTLELYSSVGSAAAAFLLMGMDSTTLSLFTSEDSTPGLREAVFPSALWIETILALCFMAAVFLFYRPLGDALSGIPAEGILLFPVAFFTLAASIGNVSRAGHRATGRPKSYLASTLVAAFASTFAIAVVLIFGPSVRNILIAQAIGAGAGGLVGLVLMKGLLGARPERAVKIDLLRLGFPYVYSVGAVVMAEVVHRWWLLRVDGAAAVGALGLAVRLAAVMAFVGLALQTAWYPRVINLLRDPIGTRVVSRDTVRIASLLGLIAASLAAISPEVVILIGSDVFADSVEPVGWLLAAALGLAFFQMLTVSNVVGRDFTAIGISSVVGVFVGLGLAVVFVPRFGAVGTAASMAIGQWFAVGAVAILNRRKAQNKVPVRIPLLAATLPAISCVLLTFDEHGWPLRLGVVLVVACWAGFFLSRPLANDPTDI